MCVYKKRDLCLIYSLRICTILLRIITLYDIPEMDGFEFDISV
jgi:hypothetical protein